MAWRSSGRHGVGVYFVWPLSSATLAASLMNAGVSKSGSPAPKPTTSTPAFFKALALALTARVIESATSFIRSARANIWVGSPGKVAKGYERRGVKASRPTKGRTQAFHECGTRIDTNGHESSRIRSRIIREDSCEFVSIRVPPNGSGLDVGLRWRR